MTTEQLLHQYREKLEKAAITRALGGQLNPREFNRFKRTVLAQNQLLQSIEVTPMRASAMMIHAITIARRQMRKHVEMTEPGMIAQANFPKRSLTTIATMTPFDVSLEWIEENIEGLEGERKLREDFSTAYGNDLLDLAINGDSAAADEFLKINDGWIKRGLNDSLVHLTALPGETDWLGKIFPALVDNMPPKYRGPKGSMAIFCSPDTESAYRRQIAQRNTALGDRYLVENAPVFYEGYRLEVVVDWPTKRPMLTYYKNLHIGIGRSVRVDREYRPRKSAVEYTIHSKTDANYAVSEMVSLVDTTPPPGPVV